MSLEVGQIVEINRQGEHGWRRILAVVEKELKTAKGDTNLRFYQLRTKDGIQANRWEPSIFQTVCPLQAAILKSNGIF